MNYAEKFKNITLKAEPLILGIESSCDETAAAVVQGRKLLSSVILSSAAEQAKYGGVVPEIASRAHTDAISKAVSSALQEAHIDKSLLDAVAVTYGAGLLGALLVGLSFAKSFAYALGVPLIGVNHIRGHMAAAYLADPALEPPFITLLASGGHTAILYTKSYTEFEILGSTRDDAAGEAMDKAARVLGLPYPGGPNVERLARGGKDGGHQLLPQQGAERGRVQPCGRGGVLSVRRVRRARRAGGERRARMRLQDDRGGRRRDRQHLSAREPRARMRR